MRPAVLVLLLQELFRRKHEAFLRSPAAQAMNIHMDTRNSDGSSSARIVQELERAVYEKYPETESHLPLEKRMGSIPEGIQ